MEDPKKIKSRQTMVLVGGIVGFIALIVFGLWASDPNRGKPTPLEISRAKAAEVVKDYRTNPSVSAEESWIAQSEKDFSTVKKRNHDLAQQVERLQMKLEALEKKGMNEDFSPASSLPGVGGNNLPPHPRDASNLQKIANNTLPPPPSGAPGGKGKKEGPPPPDAIQVISLSDDSGKGKGLKNVSHYIPKGSFATAVLMSGLDAPTGGLAQKQPMPVLLRLKDDGQLPNYFNSEVSDCHLIGAGYGDISSERAYIRLEGLSCVLVNGDVVETTVKGYVTGEDGKAGLRGRLVSKQGSMIAKAALAGVFSGIGDAVSQTHQTVSQSALGNITTYDPKRIAEAGAAQGTSKALEKIADYYIARANETYPIIEIDANRIGEVIFTDGVDFGQELIGNIRKGDD